MRTNLLSPLSIQTMKQSLIFLAAVLFTAILSAQNVGINTNNPQATLDVNGSLKVNALATPDTQMLVTGPDGFVQLRPLSVPLLVDTDGDTKIQVEESINDNTIRLDLQGMEKFVIRRNASGNALFEFVNNDWNLFLGTNAGLSNSSGFSNVFIGRGTGESFTSGINNTFLGNSAANAMTSGSFNTFVGDSAGNAVSTGDFNTYIGQSAGAYNLNGSGNTFLGHQTGWFASGNNNVFLGPQVGLNATGDNQLYIDNSDTPNPLIYGEFDNDLLKVNGTLRISSLGSGGIVNQMVVADGIGNLSTQALPGIPVLLEDVDGDTKIQVEESADEDIIRFDLEGVEFGRIEGNTLHFSDNSVFVGGNAGGTASSGGTNTYVGFQAGMGTTSAIQNTFVGANSGESLQTGVGNTFMGKFSGQQATDGVANVFLGFSAGQQMSSGNDNTFVGTQAGKAHTSGNGNTFIGKDAGMNNISGANNVFLGINAGINETGSDKLYIENSPSDKPLIYGDFNSDLLSFNGHVGVGAMPNTLLGELSVIDTVDDGSSGVMYAQFAGAPGSNNDKAAIYAVNAVDDYYGVGLRAIGGWTAVKANVNPNGIDNYTAVDGNVTNLGSTGGAVNFGVFGRSNGDNSTNYGVYGEGGWGTNSTIYAGYFNGDLAYTGTLNPPSDAKLKKNIVALDGSLEKVLQLQPKSYRFKTEAFQEMNLAKGPQMGFIAQEVGVIFPDLIHQNVFVQHTDSKEEKPVKVNYVGLDYMSLIPVLTGAIQEQQQIIEDQETRIQKLEAQLQEVMSRLEE